MIQYKRPPEEQNTLPVPHLSSPTIHRVIQRPQSMPGRVNVRISVHKHTQSIMNKRHVGLLSKLVIHSNHIPPVRTCRGIVRWFLIGCCGLVTAAAGFPTILMTVSANELYCTGMILLLLQLRHNRVCRREKCVTERNSLNNHGHMALLLLAMVDLNVHPRCVCSPKTCTGPHICLYVQLFICPFSEVIKNL